jgi:hypothetical protein
VGVGGRLLVVPIKTIHAQTVSPKGATNSWREES